MMKLGVLASGQGTNLQAILDASREQRLSAEVAMVISNNSASGALERARRAGVAWRHLSARTHPGSGALDKAITDALCEHGVDTVVLAGYMRKLEAGMLRVFAGRIINTHPSLLPAFGGQGMYGMRVHQAVIASGAEASGISIHLVDGDYDTGRVIAQRRVMVELGDDAEALARRMLPLEHAFLVDTLQGLATGRIAW